MNTKIGTPIKPVEITTPMCQWENIGSITSSQATLAVSARDYTSVWQTLDSAKKAAWEVSNDVSGCFFRFHTDSHEDAHTVEMWVAAHENYKDDSDTKDHFMLGAELSLVGGQQVGPNSNVFVEQITKTANTGILAEGDTLDSGAGLDRVAIYRLDLQGWKRVVFIATTLEAGTTLYCDARGY